MRDCIIVAAPYFFAVCVGGTGWIIGDYRTFKAYQNRESESILQRIIDEQID
jgi:hypothetical protein